MPARSAHISPPTGGGARDVGARRRLPPYLLAAVALRVADEGARVALVLLAIDRTGNAALGGLAVAALLVPHVVAAPAVGLLVDRVRRPARVLAAAGCGLGAALAAVALGLGRVPVAVVVVVLLLGGCCGPGLTGALTSRLAGLVPPAALPRAFGLDALTYTVSGIVGPALAGVVAASAGPGVATLVLAACAGVGALTLAAARLPGRPARDPDVPEPPLRAGVVAVVRDPVLRAVTLASSLGQLGTGALPVVAAVLATRHHAAAGTGVLLAAVAVGALVGSLAWTARPAAGRHAPAVVVGALVATGAPLVLAAATTTSLPLTAALFAVSGLATGPFTGALFTARQAHAPAPLRAQVFAVGAGLKTSSAAAGAALAGGVAQLASGSQLALTGVLPILAGAAGAVLLRRTHRTPRPAAVAPPHLALRD